MHKMYPEVQGRTVVIGVREVENWKLLVDGVLQCPDTMSISQFSVVTKGILHLPHNKSDSSIENEISTCAPEGLMLWAVGAPLGNQALSIAEWEQQFQEPACNAGWSLTGSLAYTLADPRTCSLLMCAYQILDDQNMIGDIQGLLAIRKHW